MAEESLDDIINQLIDDDAQETEHTASQANQSGNQEQSEREAAAAEEMSEPEKGIFLTERAANQIMKIRKDENLSDELRLRVAVEGGGCSGLSYKLGFDEPAEDDRDLEHQGISIVVNPRHLLYLDGIEIDYPDGLDARGFTFSNPNASDTCGCGSSFST